jgi:tmRNA-binding protein
MFVKVREWYDNEAFFFLQQIEVVVATMEIGDDTEVTPHVQRCHKLLIHQKNLDSALWPVDS